MTSTPTRLRPCPWFWACVSSREDARARHRIEPFAVRGDPEAAFARLKRLVAGTPRMAIVEDAPAYFRARYRTRILFVDDLEFALCGEGGVIHVRSSSLPWCIWDLGANRRRLEALRREYAKAQ